MSKVLIKMLGICMAVTFMTTAIYAGSTDDPVVRKREQNQEKRIERGVKSGQLTPREAARLEREQAKIKRDEQQMKSDGKLTVQERKKLKREQNRASKHIYNQKHDRQRVDPHQ